MAKKQTRRSDAQSTLKWKRKNWHKILAPKLFDEIELGESLLLAPEDLQQKMVETNLMHLTKDIKKQNISVKFKVVDIKGTVGHTQLVSYTMIPASVKRLVRSNRDRIDDSYVVKTKDDLNVRVKPLIITRNNLSAQQRTVMRKLTEDTILSFFEKHSYDEFIKSVLDVSLVKQIKEVIGKIAPVRTVEIRAFSVLSTVKNVRFAQHHNLPSREEAPVAAAAE
jgi:small subunit ribosomal protein S3Ae